VRTNDTRREDKTVRAFRFVMFVTLWLAAASAAGAQAAHLTAKEAKNHVREKCDGLREGSGDPFCFERERAADVHSL
jgi:hypothetical protein